ncbi:DNA-directed RNA polymerase subunit beta [Candidatus Dojkabacteria bacterium]|nr:DNA-directed RNA polymerase subunit beta [Candidatus Dojkabacteria bacterium]
MAKYIDRLHLNKHSLDHIDVDLIEAQTKSFHIFLDASIRELFDEINPIEDYTGESWQLEFKEIEWGEPKHTFREAQKLGLSYDKPLYVQTTLKNKKTGEIKKQKIFVADIPMMSSRGTFVVNGNERVVVMQIVRGEGVLFTESKASKASAKPLYAVKLMPTRGRWFDFEVNKHGVMSVKLFDKRPKVLLTELLRALGYSSDAQINELLANIDTGETKYLENTLRKDPTRSTEEALLNIYRKLRPEDSISLESAQEFLNGIFFDKRRFYLGRIGRYKLNKKLGIDLAIEPKNYMLRKEDIVEVIKAVIKLNNGTIPPDDVDHLANRRIRGVGELIADRMRIGVLRVEKNIKDRMGSYSADELVTPSVIVNTRPIIAAVDQFFGSSAVSRYMDQENVLSELETKRRITAGGPGGLTKERATFSVRDVHSSHYSKLCMVTTPEGPSIGVVSHMSVYARINDYGFLEAPYFRVFSEIKAQKSNVKLLENRILEENAKNKAGKVIVKKGIQLTKKADIDKLIKAEAIVKVKPFVTNEVIYLDADDEMEYFIAPARVDKDEYNNILNDTVFVRNAGTYARVPANQITHIDINPGQIGGVSFSLIPFSFNDDPTRSLMASNMQRQAVPLLKPESAIVGTGYEKIIANASGRVVLADDDGVVIEADSTKLIVKYKTGKKVEYEAEKYIRTNQNTAFSQTVLVKTKEKFKKGDVLIDGPSMDNGELALGKNVLAAFMSYEGYNYDDGIVVSERLVKDDVFTSIHIKEYIQDIRETKLGDEQITRDIPNVGEYALRNLDDRGIVRVGASVEAQDILVGIIAPKGETELTAEEKLLRAIFGEYARDVRDNSLRVPHGDKGIVIGVQVLSKENGDKLNPGVLRQVKVWVAKTSKLQVGDKLTGLHGDKGVIAKILPEEDMPFLANGTPIDIILSPMFVKRMNVGQIREMEVAAKAKAIGEKVVVPPFAELDLDQLDKKLAAKGKKFTEKIVLYDGRTGEQFDSPIVVGPRYVLKLNHLSSDKIHARSTGAYTMVTQQPLGGKAQFGGQRFGEMEVWALEAHAVPNVLHEMLTIKSDDVIGRAAAYKSIIQGEKIESPNIPEGFRVLVSELRSLGLNLQMIEADEDNVDEAALVEGVVDEDLADQTESTETDEDIASEREEDVIEDESTDFEIKEPGKPDSMGEMKGDE